MNWVHHQWRHDGGNEPIKNDAISILEEARTGKNFRCVEYGTVVTACLNAVGLNSRVLGLKMSKPQNWVQVMWQQKFLE